MYQQGGQNQRKHGKDRLFQVTVKSIKCLPLYGRVERFLNWVSKKKSLCYKLVLTSVRSVVLGKAIKAFWSSFFSCIKLEISKCIII